MQYYIGCSGWSYSAWKGPFYPPNLESSDWLRFYSQIFDYVEIDSSFYRIPNEFMVKNWVRKTLGILTDGPSKEAVQKHHNKHGFSCEWITEVKTTA